MSDLQKIKATHCYTQSWEDFVAGFECAGIKVERDREEDPDMLVFTFPNGTTSVLESVGAFGYESYLRPVKADRGVTRETRKDGN